MIYFDIRTAAHALLYESITRNARPLAGHFAWNTVHFDMVPLTGVEPVWHRCRGILSFAPNWKIGHILAEFNGSYYPQKIP